MPVFHRLLVAATSGIKPLKRIILREDSLKGLSAIGVLNLLRMDAMQLYNVPANKDPEMEVSLAMTFGQSDFAKEMQAIG